VWLAGQIAIEQDLYAREKLRKGEKAVRECLVKCLVRLVQTAGALTPPERSECGMALSLLGDTRRGVGLRADGLPDIDWVEIPAGEFIYQDDERLTLPTFYIARYPITHAQFQVFLDAPDGFERDEWWAGLSLKYHKQEIGEQAFKYANHPRTYVSWYQAVAFCRWLSAKLGYEVTLPTEQQWEKAARGTDGREYPWGNAYISGCANINETHQNTGPHHLQQTSAVGMYPQGVSPYGVLDSSGNVWEWCPNTTDGNTGLAVDAEQVLRGGSWLEPVNYVRCAYRNRNNSYLRTDFIGFRVMCFAPMV
jgi:formylglycine-generating enzyme required for sulfatase activity